MGRACNTHRGDGKYKVLFIISEVKGPTGSRRRWKNHIKIDLKGMGWEG
jgi:hypothetical protein